MNSRKDSTDATICTFVNRISTITLNVDHCLVSAHGHDGIYVFII